MDCKQLSKAYIAKLMSENSSFANLAYSIQQKIEQIRQIPESVSKWVTEKYYDELLERAYYSTILDFPSNSLQKQNVLDMFSKDIESWVNFLKLIDSVSDWYVKLPDEVIEDMVKTFNVDKEQFWKFVDDLQGVARIKTIDQYVNSKKFSLKKFLKKNWFEDSDLKDEKLFKQISQAYIESSDEILRDIEKNISEQLIDTSELKWNALKTAISSNEKLTTRKEELFMNYVLSRTLLWWDLNFNEVSKYIVWTNLETISIEAIDSVTDIHDLRMMLYTDLPSFKSSEIYDAWKVKYDELVYWKGIKEKKLLDKLEKYANSPDTLLEEIIKAAPNRSVKKSPWTTISHDRIENTMLYAITWKKVEGEFVFFKEDYSKFSDKAQANYKVFENEIKKRSVEVWKVKTVDYFWAKDNPNVTIVVENLDSAKRLSDLPNNVIFPEEGKKFWFWSDWEKLYVWAKNDRDFENLSKRLDSERIPFNVSDQSEWFDYVEALLKQRYWDDYQWVRDLIERISPNYTEQEKFLDDLAKADLRYDPVYVKLSDEIENLPDDIEWYQLKANELAAEYWIEIETKKSAPLNYLKEKFIKTVYSESPEDYIGNVNDFLDIFWPNKIIEWEKTNINIYHQAVKIITEDWFALPMFSYKQLFDKIMKWQDITNDIFVRWFISTNASKIEELPWLTNIDKFKLYIKETLGKAEKETWSLVWKEVNLNWEVVEDSFWLYFKRNTDRYTEIISENLTPDTFIPTPDSIDKDFAVIWDLLDEHLKRMETLVKEWNDLKLYEESKRIKRAIAEYEERVLVPKYYGKYLSNKDILTRRYAVMRASTPEDIELLRQNIEDIKTGLWNVFRRANPTDDAMTTLRKSWVAFANWTSMTIDELIERELFNIADDAWDLSIFKDIDISKMNLEMKFALWTNLKATNMHNIVWNNIQKHLYEKIVPELEWFFDAYKVEQVEWIWELPQVLARTNVTARMWKANYIPSADDLTIKKNILDSVSDEVRKWNLTDDSLDKIVERELNIYYTKSVDKEWFEFEKVKEWYKEVFKPYKLLFRLPEDAIKSYYDWLKNQFDKLDKTYFDNAYVNIDWNKVPLDSVDFAPELTLPKVLSWKQEFSSKWLTRLDETYLTNLENRAKLVRDEIDEVENILWDMQVNFFADAAKIMSKSARLNRLREVVITWISKAKSAWKTLRRYSSANKENILKFQKAISDLMDISDEQFSALKDWTKDNITKDAWEVADYFRYLNRTLPSIPDDPALKEMFWATHKKILAWLTTDELGKPIDTKLSQQKLEWLAAAVWEQQIFSFIDYNPNTNRAIRDRVSQTGWLMWKYNPAWKIDDITELNQFNKAFQSNLSMNEFQKVIVAMSDFNPKGWLSATARTVKKVLNSSFLGWRRGRVLTSYPHVLSTLFTQYAWYYTLWEGYQRFIWSKSLDWVSKIRRDLNILTWEIPEFSRDPRVWAKTSTAEWIDVFDSVKENWNNIMDIFASWRLKDQVFIDAITYNTARNFSSLDEFDSWLKNADVAERNYVLDAITWEANTIFDNMMWFKTQAIYKGWNVWVLANLYTIYNSINWFRSGWWMNIARRAFDNTFWKAWDAAKYFSKYWFNKESIDNFVWYLAKDRDFQIFWNTVMFDAYYAMKLKRFMNLKDEDKEDEWFFSFMWNELLDYEWRAETLWAMSQSYQGIYSAWPLRPFLYWVEAAFGWREWWITSAFIDWLKWAAFRQFKLLYNMSNAWARLAWEAMWDWLSASDAYTIVSDMLMQSSWGTLRYMLNDKDYQKNLFYIPDQNSWLEFFFGLSNNPYVVQERRVQQIASWITFDNSVADSMSSLWNSIYIWKLWNLFAWKYWIINSLKYWSFDKNFNTVTKEDFTKVFENNPVYQWFIESGNVNTNVIPDEYKEQFYKSTYEKMTANWYFPWWPKQVDSMNEWLKNFKDETWIESQKNRWWMDSARVELMNFLWEKEVRRLVDLVENVNVKKNADDVKEDLVYKAIKEKINAVSVEDRPYWYLYLDMAYYLTRDQSKKWKSEAQFNNLMYARLDNMLNWFMKQDSYELRQEIYTEARDKTMLEAVYYSDKESFKPFFTVEQWQYWKEEVKFDWWFKGYLKSMNEVLISAKNDDLDSFEVAFSSLVKSYKDNPVAQISAYNELNQFLKWRNDIENKDEMLNWFLLKNPDLLKNPEELKLNIWVDQYNELITNLKDLEWDISKKTLDTKDVSWKWGKKWKEPKFPKITLPKIDDRGSKWWVAKPSKRSTVKPIKIEWAKSSKYKVNSNWKSEKVKENYWSYSAESKDIYWNQKSWPKDITRKVKKVTKKLLKKKKSESSQ